MSNDPLPPSKSSLGQPLGVLLGLAAATVILLGLKQVSSVVGPVFLAFTLALTFRPLGAALRKRGLPEALTGATTLLAPVLAILAIVAALALAIAQLTTELPRYRDKFESLYADVQDLMVHFGFDRNALGDALTKIDPSTLVGFGQQLLSTFSSVGSTLLVLLLTLAFLTMDTPTVRRHWPAVQRTQPELAEGLRDFSGRVRRYWVVSSVFGLIVAVLDVVALLIIGVPLALTWGVLSFVTNYIPNVGFVLGLVPPALLALLDGGVAPMIWVIVSYSVINFVLQSLIQPRYMGNAVGLNTTVTFVSLIIWSLFLGALGALLAVPLTLFVKSLFIDSRPENHWLRAFVGS
ncbi:AI-2E family transporter [Flexivirga meconopsidis]|uniref:AI-2E family transporter n=1 Tax=Flexivirga meconopsidis TaxID=2977121 RepID=UPI0022403A2C|nr:AI-2E family transporter [Flexivirga meconopsidis]